MDDPSRYHWYGEEPFPWLLLGMCFTGFTVVALAAGGVSWLVVTQFFDIQGFRP